MQPARLQGLDTGQRGRQVMTWSSDSHTDRILAWSSARPHPAPRPPVVVRPQLNGGHDDQLLQPGQSQSHDAVLR
jgi:hypothetical protein